MAIGIGIGLPFRKSLVQYPVINLTSRYVQLVSGGNLIDTRGGISIPYVSGSGLDQIFDFSVLNNTIYDKGSYVGNSFGLPATYNFPYVNIYYDPTNSTTRKYWKLKDFHYDNILRQSLLVDNRFFLKAKATTNTSNVLSSIQELLIYNTQQTSTNLDQLKLYIGIQNDFYGNNLIPSESSNFDTDGTLWWSVGGGTRNYNSSEKYMNMISSGNTTFVYRNGLTSIGNIYGIWIDLKSDKLNSSMQLYIGLNTRYSTGILSTSFNTYSADIEHNTGVDNILYLQLSGGQASMPTIGIDNIMFKKKYINYYSS